jgi:hypothetical protein
MVDNITAACFLIAVEIEEVLEGSCDVCKLLTC